MKINREYYLVRMTNNASTDCGVISFDEYKKEINKKEKRIIKEMENNKHE